MKIRDTLERLWWTMLAAFLGGLSVGGALDISTLDAALIAAATAGVNFLTLVARWRLSVLPEPGEGLPGLPVEEEPVYASQRISGHLPYDPEPTTRDRGAVSVATVCLIIVAVIAILWFFGEAPR
jgi:hypothetical protein